MRVSANPLYTRVQIDQRVRELARSIMTDFHGQELILVIVLKGATMFGADLLRYLDLSVRLEFVKAHSYQGMNSTGQIRFTMWPDESVTGKCVLLVEDIVDTGCTASALMSRFAEECPMHLSLCTLLDKPSRRETPVVPDYTGFVIHDHFVVGYGLDYNEQFRHLPAIHTLDM